MTLFFAFIGLRSRRWSSTALPKIEDSCPQISSAVDSSTLVSSAALKARRADASISRRAWSPTNGMMWFRMRLRIGSAVEGSSERLAHQHSAMQSATSISPLRGSTNSPRLESVLAPASHCFASSLVWNDRSWMPGSPFTR
ncbi:hypothetical protein [Streptomyces sp. NPDC088730]|uniref:hypothetical protein n=1 Tax=Streptomyces sp. NPDC088730 TaxID=3365877 RepID=UPI0037F43253